MGYYEIKDRSKLGAGVDALKIRIPPKGSGRKPDFKYSVQLKKGRPSVDVPITPDAPLAVAENMDWSKAKDVNLGKIKKTGK